MSTRLGSNVTTREQFFICTTHYVGRLFLQRKIGKSSFTSLRISKVCTFPGRRVHAEMVVCVKTVSISYPESSGSLASGWSPGDQPLAKEPEDSRYEIETI